MREYSLLWCALGCAMGCEQEAGRALLVSITPGSVLLPAVSRGGNSSEEGDRSALG